MFIFAILTEEAELSTSTFFIYKIKYVIQTFNCDIDLYLKKN